MAVINFTIPGRFESLNKYIDVCRKNKYMANAMKQRDQSMVESIILECKYKTFEQPAFVHFKLYEKTKRRDVDNISGYGHKVIFDALVKAKVLRDDNWECVVGHTDTFEYDKENPRIEVYVWEAEDECR